MNTYESLSVFDIDLMKYIRAHQPVTLEEILRHYADTPASTAYRLKKLSVKESAPSGGRLPALLPESSFLETENAVQNVRGEIFFKPSSSFRLSPLGEQTLQDWKSIRRSELVRQAVSYGTLIASVISAAASLLK